MKMHFSVPDYTEFAHQTSRQTFHGFNIHVNGCFHTCVRYKQLYSLNKQLTKSFANVQLPSFPKKKLFLLTSSEVEERRIALERYLQLIGQDPIFSRSELLRSFLLTSQHESANLTDEEVQFDVHLMNGCKIPIRIKCPFSTFAILERVCVALGLPTEYTYYFALFVVKRPEDSSRLGGAGDVYRKLMDFESPFITMKNMGTAFDCVLRKSYWDTAYDQDIICDPVGLNLLYIQAVSDNLSWASVEDDNVRNKLEILQYRGNKEEYLDMAKTLPSYGALIFGDCIVDYPVPNTAVTVILRNKEIQFQMPDTEQKTNDETKFRVTRIRCWKITTTFNAEDSQSTTELAFEFLMSKNYLKWIQVRSDRAMTMAVCLQGLVSELLNQKNELNNVKPTHVTKPNETLHYLRRDQFNEFKPLRTNKFPIGSSTGSADFVRTKLKKISTAVFFKNGQNRVHNEAFEGIGDDDL